MKLLVLPSILLAAVAFARKPPGLGKTHYHVSLQKDLTPCEDFNNTLIEVNQLMMEKRGKTEVAFVGSVVVNKDLDDLEYAVDIFVDRSNNWEYLDTYEDKDLCHHMVDKEKLWSPFIQEMGLSGCPIKQNTYTVKDSTVDMSKFPLSEKSVGLYRCIAYVLQKGEKISCHFADVAITT